MNKREVVAFGLAILLVIVIAGVSGAGSSANFAIDWWVFSGGGAPATAGDVNLKGSLGQTAIGLSTGSNVSLNAGYWNSARGQAADDRGIYLPVILRTS